MRSYSINIPEPYLRLLSNINYQLLMFSHGKNTIESFYTNRIYTILRIVCTNQKAHQHIACSGEAQLMLRSGEVILESGEDCISIKNGETVLLHKNLVYSLKTSGSFDLLVAYSTNSNLLYPVEIVTEK